MVFLNGTNINGVRNQDLSNVNIRIDEAGNFHITAPQYDVQQDSSYHPLMPSELPRFPKRQTGPVDLPQGRFSKETGLPSSYLPGNSTAQTGLTDAPNTSDSSANASSLKAMAVEDLPPESLPQKPGEITSVSPRQENTQPFDRTQSENRGGMILPPNPIKPVGAAPTRTADAGAAGNNGTAAKAKPAQTIPERASGRMESNVVPPPELPPEAQGPSL
jgi:hypothetical protein